MNEQGRWRPRLSREVAVLVGAVSAVESDKAGVGLGALSQVSPLSLVWLAEAREHRRADPMAVWGVGAPGRGSSKCKGPEVPGEFTERQGDRRGQRVRRTEQSGADRRCGRITKGHVFGFDPEWNGDPLESLSGGVTWSIPHWNSFSPLRCGRQTDGWGGAGRRGSSEGGRLVRLGPGLSSWES